MNQWKDLTKDSIPPDFITGDYEVQYFDYSELEWLKSQISKYVIRTILLESKGISYRYRKPEPKVPTHEEIMKLWWWDNYRDRWVKVIAYNGNYQIVNDIHDKNWFTDKKSVVLPPE